jgi:hypothetical protein
MCLALLGSFACSPQPEVRPFEGPGVDDDGELLAPHDGEYAVGVTFLHVKNAVGPGQRFGDLTQRIGEYLLGDDPPEGFVGVSFRNVGRLQWWTLTVWEDQASMYGFVASPLHLEAVAITPEVSQDYFVSHRLAPAEEVPPSWDDALLHLEELRALEEGEPLSLE